MKLHLKKKRKEIEPCQFSKEDTEMANKHENEMLSITNHQENANQNHNAILPDLCKNSHNKEIRLDAVAHACNPNTLGGQRGQII